MSPLSMPIGSWRKTPRADFRVVQQKHRPVRTTTPMEIWQRMCGIFISKLRSASKALLKPLENRLHQAGCGLAQTQHLVAVLQNLLPRVRKLIRFSKTWFQEEVQKKLTMKAVALNSTNKSRMLYPQSLQLSPIRQTPLSKCEIPQKHRYNLSSRLI